MIDTIAITIGTTARNDANTKASTSSAPRPPIRASSRTPGPSPPPLSCCSASKPVRCTGRAADRDARDARPRVLLRLRVLAEGSSRGRAADRRARRSCARRSRRRPCRRSTRRRRRAIRAALAARRVIELREVRASPAANRPSPPRGASRPGAGERCRRPCRGTWRRSPGWSPSPPCWGRRTSGRALGRGAGGHDPGDRQQDPADDDGALVGQDPACK